MLIPFPVGYVSGILKQIPANIVVCALLVSIEVKMAATLHLFHYRFITASASKKIFPTAHIALFMLAYSMTLIAPAAVIFTCETRQVLAKYQNVPLPCFEGHTLFRITRVFLRNLQTSVVSTQRNIGK